MRVKRKTTEPTRKQNYSTDSASSSFSTCRHCGGLSRRAHGVSIIVSGIEVSNSPSVASIHGGGRIVHTHSNTLRAPTLGPCGPRHPSGPRHATPCKKLLQPLFKVSHLLPHHLVSGWEERFPRRGCGEGGGVGSREVGGVCLCGRGEGRREEGGPNECFCLSAFV